MFDETYSFLRLLSTLPGGEYCFVGSGPFAEPAINSQTERSSFSYLVCIVDIAVVLLNWFVRASPSLRSTNHLCIGYLSGMSRTLMPLAREISRTLYHTPKLVELYIMRRLNTTWLDEHPRRPGRCTSGFSQELVLDTPTR